MHIADVEIRNYKSFLSSGVFRLEKGFNIVTGQNNAGKSALLEALGLQFPAAPHSTLKSKPRVSTSLKSDSSVTLTFVVDRDEVYDAIFVPNTEFCLPLPSNPQSYGITNHISPQPIVQFATVVLSQPRLEFNVMKSASTHGEKWTATRTPSFGVYEAHDATALFTFRVNNERRIEYVDSRGGQPPSGELGANRVAPWCAERVYLFKAERFNISVAPFGSNNKLYPNALNLPEVLNILQANRDAYRDFNRLVSTVLPQVKLIAVQPAKGARAADCRRWTGGDHCCELRCRGRLRGCHLSRLGSGRRQGCAQRRLNHDHFRDCLPR